MLIYFLQKFAEILCEKATNLGMDCDTVNLKDFEPEDNLSNEVQKLAAVILPVWDSCGDIPQETHKQPFKIYYLP